MTRNSHTTFKQTMQTTEHLRHLTSPHVKAEIKEDWDTMGNRDSETAASMPVSMKSEPDISFYFSNQKSHPTEAGCAENGEYRLFDIKTEIKSELTIDENVPLDFAGWFVDPLQDHIIPKDETEVVGVKVSDGQKEASVNALHEESLQETQGVKCDTEVLMLTEPKKSHQEGRVCHVLNYSPRAKAAVREVDKAETQPESSSEHHSLCGQSNRTASGRDKGPYPCPTCGKKFTFKHNIRKHAILHTGEKPHKCHLCGKAFSRSDSLADHLLIHTNGEGRVMEGESRKKGSKKKDGERAHWCDVCGKSFSKIFLLQEHQQRHAEQRPFTCNQCHKGFKVRRDLLEHQGTHTGVRPYVCKVCGQGFTRMYSLQRHSRAHTGQMPYSCPHCQKTFRSRWGLLCHIKRHTE